MKDLVELDVDYIVPMHCTGEPFYEILKAELPKKLIRSYTGTNSCSAPDLERGSSAGAQPIKKTHSLGLLRPGPPEARMGTAMRDRLRQLGYTEARDILLEARWAGGRIERLD